MTPQAPKPIHYSSRWTFVLLALVSLVWGGCASEDPNIINPPPGTAHVAVRMINMVPDTKLRKLILERGYQTSSVAYGSLSATVDSPSDSSFIEIVADGVTEYRSSDRVHFSKQSVYDIIAVGKPNGGVGFDTIMVSNANRTLTTQPVAQVRVINTFPDTLRTFLVHIGCPNGPSISKDPVPFKTATLYAEMSPGNAVFSIQQSVGGQDTQLGTFECTLEQRIPYSIIVRQQPGDMSPAFTLIHEGDFTESAERPFMPVAERDANMRVLNVSAAPATVTLTRTGQKIAENQSPLTMSSYVPVPTCEQNSPDVLSLVLSDGRSTRDSTSLMLRGSYTIVSADNGDSVRMIIVPPMPVVYDAAGKSIIRVVNAATRAGKVNVSTGARTDVDLPNGVVTGISLASNFEFGDVSDPVVLPDGELPITVTTSQLPTILLEVRRSSVEPNKSYILVVSETADGMAQAYLLEDTDGQGSVQPMNNASLLTFVNASPVTDNIHVSIGTVILNGRVYFRNSLATSALAGPVGIYAGGIQLITHLEEARRTLAIYTVRQGAETMFPVTADPLRQIPGQSDRRVINATGDLDLVTIAYDTLYHMYPDSSDIVARDVPFGQTSATHVLQRDRRGSMYVYDASTRNLIYTLPITVGPLGNSYSFIVVGRKENGYEVIVLQEF